MQAAKRTPVDLQEWAISIMDRYNRKSHLGPPAPKSLKENAPPSPVKSPLSAVPPRKPVPNSKYSRSPQHPSSSQYTPTQPHHSTQPPGVRSVRSPPLSLEHLSLETKGDDGRTGRRPNRLLVDPTSAIEPTSRPFMSPRSISSHNTKSQTDLHSATLPIRAAPTPVSAGGTSRGQPGSSGAT